MRSLSSKQLSFLNQHGVDIQVLIGQGHIEIAFPDDIASRICQVAIMQSFIQTSEAAKGNDEIEIPYFLSKVMFFLS